MREGVSEGRREGGREEGREGGREGGRQRQSVLGKIYICIVVYIALCDIVTKVTFRIQKTFNRFSVSMCTTIFAIHEINDEKISIQFFLGDLYFLSVWTLMGCVYYQSDFVIETRIAMAYIYISKCPFCTHNLCSCETNAN